MSETWLVIIGAGGTLLLLCGLVLLRTLSKGKAEVRLTDAAIAIVPLIAILLATGKIEKLVFGADGVTIETAREAILSASNRDVELQVDKIVPQRLNVASKAGPRRIPDLVARGVQALKFQVGGNFYVPDIMKRYFDELSKSDRFKYMVLVERNGRFFGILDARKLQFVLNAREPTGPFRNWSDVRNAIANNPKKFGSVPSFVSARSALPVTASKRVALQRLQKENREWLPVVDEKQHFVGITDRARLTAGLLLAVTEELEKSAGKK